MIQTYPITAQDNINYLHKKGGLVSVASYKIVSAHEAATD